MMDAIAVTKENVKLTYDDSHILHNSFSMKIKHTPVVLVDVSEDDFTISAQTTLPLNCLGENAYKSASGKVWLMDARMVFRNDCC